MQYIHRGHNNLHLRSRNEGKIKSYESCTDVRAWSHDIMRRDCFLREWMKSDMLISIVPVQALSVFLETMTGRRWLDGLKAIPKCHAKCKSKVVLQSICASCHVMKECLKDDTDFEKYFAEEEFETCNWPCERCLEVLKSIKMFWKIIMEKIFGINILKGEELDTADLRDGSIQSVAKIWEKGMVKQALLVKNIAPTIAQKSKLETKCVCYNHNNINERSFSQKSCRMNKGNTVRSLCTKGTNAHVFCPCTQRQSDDISEKKFSKCTFVKVKTEDIACDTSNVEKENDEINSYKHNIQLLHEELISQKNEMESLKQDNKYLKLELEHFYKSFTVKSRSLTAGTLADNNNSVSVVPQPFEDCIDSCKTADVVDNIESEMIITLENCKNKEYKYVSLLKVLHKTNVPVNGYDDRSGPCYAQENPMDILTKVQNTFGALVKREMGITNKANTSKRFEISASFHNVNPSNSAPSCCIISSELDRSK